MGIKENMQELLQDTGEVVEELREADRQPDPKGFVRLTSEQTGKLISVITDVAGILNSNLDLIADAHGG